MKTFHQFLKTIVATMVCTICFSMNAPTADAQWTPVMNECPEWSVEFMGKVYDRPSDDLNLPLVQNTITNQVLLTSDQAVDLNGGTGAEVNFNFHGKRFGTPLELRMFIADFEEANSVSGTNLFTPLFPTITPDNVFTDYESQIFSVELNATRTVRPGVTLLAGPRFVSLREDYTASFDQQVTTPIAFLVEGSSNVQARNSMYGYQLGFELNFPVHQNMHLQGFGRFGGFANPTRVITTTTDNVSNTTTSTEFKQTTGTFIGEVGGRLYTEIIPKRVHGFVGYEATWIDGVALGPPQLLTTNPVSAIDTENTPFFHAIVFGFGYTY